MELRPGGKLRVRTGCGTCRIRKIRCDEAKPSCERCVKTGRKCDGYRDSKSASPDTSSQGPASPNMARRSPLSGPPSKPLTLPAFDDDQQRQVFAFFVSHTSTASTLYYRTDFWSYRTLQLSLTEPAIKYALCSLSALHNMFRASHGKTTPSGWTAAEHRNYSLIQYNLAVKHTQKLLERSGERDIEVVIKGLVACVLFICYENLVGNYRTAQMHLQNGLKIISRHAKSGTTRSENPSSGNIAVPYDIVQVLHRLDLQAMSFTDSKERYPYQLPHDAWQIDTTPLPPFTSINAATDFLINIFRSIFRLAAASEPNLIPQPSLDSLATTLQHWSTSFNNLLTTTNCQEKYPNSVLILKIYHILISIIISTRVYGFETLHDTQLSRYQCLITLSATLLCNEEKADPAMLDESIFSFEPGVIFALFFTAMKCRDSIVRREAVELLRKNDHQEGAWESVGAAAVAEFVIGIEAENLVPGIEGMVEEADRVHLVTVCPVVERRKIDVSCLMRSKVDGTWFAREGSVVY